MSRPARGGLVLALLFGGLATVWLVVEVFTSPLRPSSVGRTIFGDHLLNSIAPVGATIVGFFVLSIVTAVVVTRPWAKSGAKLVIAIVSSIALTLFSFTASIAVMIAIFGQTERIWFYLYSESVFKICQTDHDTSREFIRDLQANSSLALCPKTPRAGFYCEAKSWNLGACSASIFYRPIKSTEAANAYAYKAQLRDLHDIESTEYVYARKDKSAMFYEFCENSRGLFQ